MAVRDTRAGADFIAAAKAIVGEGNLVFPDGAIAGASHYQVDGMQPQLAVRPGTREEVREIVRLARSFGQTMIPVGAGTKLGIGMPPRSYALALDMSRLNRVLAYDPGDLTISVEAGCRLRDLQTATARQGQFLPFEPAYVEHATIGGSLAAGSSSLCAAAYGTPRDFVLGMEFVTGEGELAHSGGRVVKNVTGYDLHKLMIGSFGTLGVIVSVNFRLYPLLEMGRFFAASFETDESAFSMLHEITASYLKPRTLVIADPSAMAQLRTAGMELGGSGDSWTVVAIVRGHKAVLDRHGHDMRALANKAGAREFVAEDGEELEEITVRLREFTVNLKKGKAACIGARIGVAPADARGLLGRIREDASKEEFECTMMFHATGIAEVALWSDAVFATTGANGSGDRMERLGRVSERICEVAKEYDSRAMIEWCPLELKSKMNIWGEPTSDFTLMQKVKAVFDPDGIFSPGRFVGGL
jgi:glycolate oxidase FAD binding subunit